MENAKLDIKVDKLNLIYLKAREKMISEFDMMQNDITDVFYQTLKAKILHNHLIVICIRGEVRGGKSTVMVKLVHTINKILNELGLVSDVYKTMTNCIVSDQTEFLRMTNTKKKNIAIGIDEFNRLASTGFNATTELALFEQFSDYFAVYKWHRVSCSPDVILDKNTSIVLDVIGKDPIKNVTRCKVTYRNIINNEMFVIGHINVNVNDIIDTWVKSGVKELIEVKTNLSLEQVKEIEAVKEKDFYTRYQVKKIKRLELIQKHGVRDVRDLEFSGIILDVTRELQDFAKIKKVTQETVVLMVDEIRRKHKRIYSIPTLNEIGTKCKALLGIYTEIQNLNRILGGGGSKKYSVEQKDVIAKTIVQQEDFLRKRIDEQEKLNSLFHEFMNVN